MKNEPLRREQIEDALRTVFDPEIPVNIFDLGLVYQININEDQDVQVYMTLTAPACPAAGQILQDAEDRIKAVPGVNQTEVRLTFDPPWDRSMMSDEARLELGLL